ncbi:serine/threonine-protein kinase STY13-like protein [Tanacetum coccineum]
MGWVKDGVLTRDGGGFKGFGGKGVGEESRYWLADKLSKRLTTNVPLNTYLPRLKVTFLQHRFAGRGNEPDPRDVKIASLKQRIQELEFPQLQQDSPAEEAETESNVWDDGSEDVNPFGGGNPGFHDDHYDNPLLTKETESEPIIWDIGDEEEEYPFVNKYPSFQEEPIVLVEEESCPVYDTDNEEEESMPVYDTDIEDVIEEEEGFVGKGGFGGEEDNIEDVVVVANDLCSSMIQTILSVDFEEDINTKSHELMSFGKIRQKQKLQQQEWAETIDPSKLLLGNVIGRGTFGVVHKGSYYSQTVAVKVLDFGDKKTKVSMERMKNDFEKEVGLWKNLDHPNVTKMIGATMSMKTDSKQKNKKSKTESDFCIVSEYLKGGSLRSYLEKNRKKKLPLKIVIRFALDIAKGLSYLHSEKIIHRDVKPDNMLMDEKKLIKLADFGESVVEPLYMKSCEVGTLGYMAPEVLSRKPYSHKCDVYAFGICLWEIQCCDMAYTYDLENIPSDIYKELRPSIPLDCPRSLANLMEQCWHTDPSKRPEMKDVVIELEKIGKAEGLQTQSEDREAVYGCFCVFRH